ncbi:hypothetical protein TRAPUB_2299 [Trametes pubescens]|uniref:Uncharacterized protein n=1 Tax=Trametes pubescens TaxID=154538 RepID=A0A1M2VGZ1_TRAPU|nr:hypothetical protein TRAPUB_2299 [Trametes pubescens]
MTFNLKLKNYMVFASIFKGTKGDQQSIHWRDFIRAMDNVGFDCYKERGTVRTFKSRSLEVKSTFRCREPQDRVLTARKQKL